ncbi:hypothetical protein DITRI_Ditri03aG0179900 [Diplodiscus trichospermus]
MRLHLMKETLGPATSLKRALSLVAVSPDAVGESSSLGAARLDKKADKEAN